MIHGIISAQSISNRRSRSSRNEQGRWEHMGHEHIESEIALKPELRLDKLAHRLGAYRIGDRAQAGTDWRRLPEPRQSISNRRSRSSRNTRVSFSPSAPEHIESEIALKPEPLLDRLVSRLRAYRIGDRAQAGTCGHRAHRNAWSISNRRSRSSRNERSHGIWWSVDQDQ